MQSKTTPPTPPTVSRDEAILALSAMVETGAVKAAFQPIVDLRLARIAGSEALMRPNDLGPFPSVDKLFDAATETGLLWSIEDLARRRAFEAAADWEANTLLFLNCSPAVFSDPRFPGSIRTAVDGVEGLDPHRIVLEITERSDQQFITGLAEQVERVKADGFQIAIDDVGAGTSGLSRIMQLRPRWLKLDRELVRMIHRDRVRQNMVRFMIHFGQLSGVQIIAEGIETADELGTLLDLGVRFGQGYYLGKPVQRRQTLDDDVTQEIRTRASAAAALRLRDPRTLSAERFGHPVITADVRDSIAEVAARLLPQPNEQGVCVTEGGVAVAWCDRRSLVLAAATMAAERPISTLARPCLIVARDEVGIVELIELAAAQGPTEHATVIVLTDHRQQPETVLANAELMNAAAELITASQFRSVSLPSLPGRVRCDQHLGELISVHRHTNPNTIATVGCDAAFIDVRDFDGYNWSYGHDLGNQLLAHLASLIHTTVVGEDANTFLGHIGDDRFLVTAPSGTLERKLDLLRNRFERTVDNFCGMLETDDGRGTASRNLGLRMLLFHDVIRRVDDPSELYHLESQLRQRAKSIEASGERASILLCDPEQHSAEHRRSA